MVVLEALLIMALISFILFKVICYICYRFSTGSDSAPMKWSMIKKLYVINPKRFHYEDSGYGDMKVLYYTTSRDGIVQIKLSFFGYQCLRFNYLKYLLDKNKKKGNKNLQKILESAQLDIDSLMEKAKKEQSKGKSMLLEILESLERNR